VVDGVNRNSTAGDNGARWQAVKLNKENRERCGKIIKLNPRDFQLQIAQEELAELIQAISKYLRYGEIEPLLEEYADVEVIMEELRQMFDIQQKEIDNRCAKKLWRALDGRVLINADVEGNSGKAHVK
jgi:hypothetical protein